MPPTEERRSGGDSGAAARVWATDTKSTADHRHSELPDARAVAYHPAGRRHRFLLLVNECPYCGAAHQHYAQTVRAMRDGVRAGCGKPYRLHVTAIDLRTEAA